MVVQQIKTRTSEYLVVDFGDSRCVSVYRMIGRAKPVHTDVEFRSVEDYRNFIHDLEEANKSEDDLQGDITVEKLLEKTKISWQRGEQ